MRLTSGDRLGPYEVLSLVGAGGMGEVYRARDPRLDRTVAIKVLPADHAQDPGDRARLAREGKAIAAFVHPHVCTLHDVGHEGTIDYLVMEYVDGETLAAVLQRGPLAPPTALAYAAQIADALEKAHGAGVVHRDLKPSNVMVTADGVKVMDFGVAARVPAGLDLAAAMTSTRTGGDLLVGTPAYMSPEQLRGQSVDQRSDVFAFGVLLFEMLTGVHPFAKPSAIETIDAILNAPAPAVTKYWPAAPDLAAHLLSRCLAKDRGDRYRSFHDVRLELTSLTAAPHESPAPGVARRSVRRRWTVAAALLVLAGAGAFGVWRFPGALPFSQRAFAFNERDWIVVGDFDNQTGDAVFDRSLRTALEAGLSQSQYVNVLPRGRVEGALKPSAAGGQLTDAAAIDVAIREGARAVVACAIGQIGDVYSLTARLVDPRSRAVVRTYTAQAKGKNDVLPALDKLATTMRRGLGESLSMISRQGLSLPNATTSSLEALKMYADAMSRESDVVGDELLRQAIRVDPEFALARAELGRRYYLKADPEVRRLGEQQFQEALKRLDRLTVRERLWITASAEDSRGNREAAVNAYKTYLSQYPDDARAWFRMGWTQMATLGQMEPAIVAFNRVLQLQPREAAAHINLASCYGALGRRRESIAEYEKGFAARPELLIGEFVNHEYGFALVDAGEADKAEGVFAKMIAAPDVLRQARGYRSLALLQMYQGRYGAATDSLRRSTGIFVAQHSPVSEFRNHLFLASAFQARGQAAGAGAELDAAEAMLRTASLAPDWISIAATMRARAGQVTRAKALLSVMVHAPRNATAGSATNRNMSRDQAYVDLVTGQIALAEHRPADALAAFQSSQAIEPRTEELLAGMGDALSAMGRYAEAVKQYEALLAARPFGKEAQEAWLVGHVTLGGLYERLGRTDAARTSYEALVRVWANGDPDLVALRTARTRLAALDR